MDGPAEQAAALLRPLVEAAGCILHDVEWKGGLLRVSVDRDGGVDLTVLGQLTPVVSAALDEADPIPGRYTLEVSSPGLERPLRTPAHFRRAVGTTISVKLSAAAAGEGDRRVKGVLDEADDEGIVVAGRRVELGDVEKATTVFEWGPAPKPGKGPKKAKVT